MRALLLCLFLAACASPERHELRDGVPVRPAPVFVTPGYTPAGAGLPEYMPGQPEPVRVEPNPRPTRLLPQTPATARQPGIWAARPPLWPDREAWPRVLDVQVPLPLDEREPLEGILLGVQCAKKLGTAIDVLGLTKPLMDLHFMDRQCLVARLYKFCAAKDIATSTKRAIDKGRDDISKQRGQTLDLAAAFEAEACNGILNDPLGGIRKRIEDRWDTIEVLPDTRKP